jgi:RNA polymerase sigma-70 factor (ECF subfamily)
MLYSVVDGVAEALESLYRDRYGRFEAVLASVTGDRESGRDVVQEAFATALARAGQFRGDGSLEGWVWKIALRLAARRPRRSRPLPEGLEESQAAPGRLDEDVLEGLRMLSPRRRLFIFLRYFADLSYAEIAEACGVSRGTVAATLAEARSQLEPFVERGRTAV